MEQKTYKKVVMLADIHYGKHASNIEWMENMNSYFHDFFIPWLKNEADDQTCLVIMGDYFDNRQSIDINIMISAINTIKAISQIVPVYMMVGNHDLYKKSGLDKSSLSCIESIPNICIIDDKMDGVCTLNLTNGETITMISWVGDHIKEATLINEYKKTSPIIFLHTELCGMNYDNGREITEGTIVKLPKGVRIFSGHIHKRQMNKSGSMMYIGSPYHMERSDIGNQKGIHMLYVDGIETKLQYVPNTFSPEYVKMTMTIDESGNWKLDKDLSKITNNYVDIEYDEDVANAINSNKVAEELLKYKPKNLEFFPIPKHIEINSEDIECGENVGVVAVSENTIRTMDLKKTLLELVMKRNTKYIQEASEALGIQY